MPKIVMKFGGTSVADIARISMVAKRIKNDLSNDNQIIAVVSAMAGYTNELTREIENISPLYDAREYSAVVSTGENVTAGLLARIRQGKSVNERSGQGWQGPIKNAEE